jgi:hypothetical protein
MRYNQRPQVIAHASFRSRLPRAEWLLTLTVLLNGCAAAALSLGMEAVQLGVNGTAVVASSMQKNKPGDPADDFGVDDAKETASERRLHNQECDELLLTAPPIIQLRAEANGSTSWRQLHLGGSPDTAKWMVVLGGWHAVGNLEQLDFSPPLPNAFEVGQPVFMPYAPAEPGNSVEEDRLRALTTDFGTPAGNFNWGGRIYDYLLVERLPCFPVAS